MQIIIGTPPDGLSEKYIVLELDTIQYAKDTNPLTAYCVISGENVALEEVGSLQKNAELHHELIRNYQNQNWEFCEEAIDSLKGKFKGEVDSFYDTLSERIEQFKKYSLDEQWDGVLKKF